jgi:hypothetical protein
LGSCCAVEVRSGPSTCPECGKAGRKIDRITVKGLLRPTALARLSAPDHRFCATPQCPVVYFGRDEAFGRDDILVDVFQKERPGDRMVCYCFRETDGAIRWEIQQTGRSPAAERIAELVAAGRCACEVRNPQGSCCLGNIALVTRDAMSTVAAAPSRS